MFNLVDLSLFQKTQLSILSGFIQRKSMKYQVIIINERPT